MTAAHTASARRRWWHDPDYSVESEVAWFADAELPFALDEPQFERQKVVVFRGTLRLHSRTTPATVVYPPSYHLGGHPMVFAPELDLGRHQGPDGSLCLDHPVASKTRPMCGAEAAARAQELWRLVEEDPDALHAAEADAPDPRWNYYEWAEESAVVLVDADVAGGESGFLTLGATQLEPLRAAATRVEVRKPDVREVPVPDGVRPLAGGREVRVAWVRVAEPPPVTLSAFGDWAQAHHSRLIERQLKLTRGLRAQQRVQDLPTVVGFVYPDEGPGRGEVHDAWVFFVLDRDGRGRLARSYNLHRSERFVRQPQLAPMADKRAAVLGVGALGSQVADLLAKAGIGGLSLVDGDVLSGGNRVRHQLDLLDVGRWKAQGTAVRAFRVDPWVEPAARPARLGHPFSPPNEGMTQEADDQVAEELRGCDVIVNATASAVPSRYLSQIGSELDIPVVHVWVSPGAWGGRVLVQRPGVGGCALCLALHQRDESDVVPAWSADPDVIEVMDMGCADPSFTGPGFELTTVAAQAARVAVQALVGDVAGHPALSFDLATLTLRTGDAAEPATLYTQMPVHPRCGICRTRG